MITLNPIRLIRRIVISQVIWFSLAATVRRFFCLHPDGCKERFLNEGMIAQVVFVTA